MSKVIFEYDTVTKQLTATMDGTTIDNISDVCFYKRWSENKDEVKYSMGIGQSVRNDNGTATWTQTSAAEIASASELVRPESVDYSGIIAKMYAKKE